MRPRILLVGLNFPPEPTGIAPYTGGLAYGLVARGFDVDVVTSFPHYPQWKSDRSVDPRTEGSPMVSPSVDRVRHYVPSDPTGARRALSELTFGFNSVARRWGSPDLIVGVSPALLGTGLVLTRATAQRSRVPFGLVVQDLYSAGVAQVGGYASAVAGPLTTVEALVLRKADSVVAIHDRFKRRMVTELGIPDDRVTVIRNWTHVSVDGAADRTPERRRRGWGDDDFVVLHTGAMGEKQALNSVVDAARMADQVEAPVRFVLVGDGGQRAELEAAARGVERIEFLSPVAEEGYPHLLAAADLLLVNERPGVADMAVPSKLTSYFSSGVPVLAATESFSTTAEEIASSGAGVVVAPGDPAVLLDAVSALASDADRRGTIGRNGPAYCGKVLSEKAALDAYAEWAGELIARRHGATA